MDVKYTTDTKIEDNARLYKLQKANFDKEINTAVSIKFVAFSRINSSVIFTPKVFIHSMIIFVILMFFFLYIRFKKFKTPLIHKLFANYFYLQKAEAQLAYELQAAKTRQKIRNEEIQIEVVERKKQIEVIILENSLFSNF